MRKVSLCLVVLLLAAGASAGSWQKTYKPTQKDRVCIEWLLERIAEAKSIKLGMSLEDLLSVYELGGGLQSTSLMERIQPSGDADDDDDLLSSRFHEGRFVLRTCRFIKVRVDFEIPAGIHPPDASNRDVKITKLSRIYLEPPHVD